MIIGRNDELNQLSTYYEREKSQIIVLYGQKYIGKTALLKEFMSDKPGFYYLCEPCSEREQRYRFGCYFASLGIRTLKYPEFSDIFACFGQKHTQKKVIVIDEFEYLIKACPDFMEKLIAFIHSSWNRQEYFVILCSSSISFVENSMVERIGEAAFELSGFIKVKELGFKNLRDYFSLYTNEECAVVWSILGGVPGLWSMFDEKASLKENIVKNILSCSASLRRVGKEMISSELRETGVYNTILSAICDGNTKLNDLHAHTEFSRAKISVYLKTLMELEFVRKVFSAETEGHDNARKGIYNISVHFLDFYYTFLFKNSSLLDTLSPEEFYTSVIIPGIKAYTGKYFKEICLEYLKAKNERNLLPIKAVRFDSWDGKQGNLDVVATDSEGNNLLALCVYDKPMVTYEDYEKLLFLAGKARVSTDHIFLFAGGRFDEKLNLEAKIGKTLNLVLLDRI